VGRRPRRKMEIRLETKQMKLTKETLKQIIKEELDALMAEGPSDMGSDIMEFAKSAAEKMGLGDQIRVVDDRGTNVIAYYPRDGKPGTILVKGGEIATDYQEELPPEVQKLVSIIKQKMNQ
jgi:hypothetical protein